jgi:LDH2 family malate/lactate/ureidoglycolate dehydrogenase
VDWSEVVTTKTAEELESLVTEILSAGGADGQNAAEVAEHLVLANLSGVDTHGVWHVGGYLNAVDAGELLPTAKPAMVRETPTTALITGNWTFGQVTANFGIQVAIEKAASQNVAVVGLVQTHHIGRLGHFVEVAAEAGMIAMVWTGGYSEEEPATVPYGGRGRVLHTNPVAMGFPGDAESHMMFDFATTAASGVKIVNAHRRNEDVPAGWIVDKSGSPTTNPADFFEGGGHIPFGGHKGYGIMMAGEYLGRIITGADDYVEAGRGGPINCNQGVTMTVMKADLFRSLSDFTRQADEMERRVRAVPPAPGFDEVLAPGDLEERTRIARRRDGIPIADDVWQSLIDAADRVNVKREKP